MTYRTLQMTEKFIKPGLEHYELAVVNNEHSGHRRLRRWLQSARLVTQVLWIIDYAHRLCLRSDWHWLGRQTGLTDTSRFFMHISYQDRFRLHGCFTSTASSLRLGTDKPLLAWKSALLSIWTHHMHRQLNFKIYIQKLWPNLTRQLRMG